MTFVLNNIFKINEENNTYTASIDVKLSWKDPALAFDPNEYGMFRRELNLDQATKALGKMWHPDVVISNMKGLPMSKEPCLLIDANGSVNYIQRIKAVFDTNYHLAPFPFDKEHLLIRLTSYRYNDSEVTFFQTQEQLNQSGVREGLSLTGWNFLGVHYASSNIRGLDGRFFPQFTIQVDMSRQPAHDLFAFAPLLLIVIVPTILTLYATAGVDARLSTWSGAILALIALSFTLQLRYPALPTDSILNNLIAIIFGYEFIMICITMTVFNPPLMDKIKNPYLIPETIRFMRWQVPFIFLIVVAIAILLTLVNA